jgi:hypothetical protein
LRSRRGPLYHGSIAPGLYPPQRPPPPGPPASDHTKVAVGCAIAAVVALGVPTVMIGALFIFILGACGLFK